MSESFEEFERRRHCTHTNATDEEVFGLISQLKAKDAEIEALRVFIGEIGAACGDPYDTAIHLTVQGMINRYHNKLQSGPD